MADQIHDWERDVAAFWEAFSDDDPDAVAQLDALADRCPADDGRAEF